MQISDSEPRWVFDDIDKKIADLNHTIDDLYDQIDLLKKDNKRLLKETNNKYQDNAAKILDTQRSLALLMIHFIRLVSLTKLSPTQKKKFDLKAAADQTKIRTSTEPLDIAGNYFADMAEVSGVFTKFD